MPLLKNGEIVADPWRSVDDAAPLEGQEPVIVSLERWQAERAALRARGAPVGVRLRSHQTPAAIADDVERFGVIVVEFPSFTDGRGFSHGRQLRERYGYRGELRASGHLIRDQYLFLARCGFDALEVPDEAQAQAWHAALQEFSVVYQPATDGRIPAYRLRQMQSAGLGRFGEAAE